jgi:hypothetical protein
VTLCGKGKGFVSTFQGDLQQCLPEEHRHAPWHQAVCRALLEDLLFVAFEASFYRFDLQKQT